MAYQRILQLGYVEDLLEALKTVFISLYEPIVATFVASLRTANGAASAAVSSLDLRKALSGWDKVFDKVLKGIEDKAAQDRKSRLRSAVRVPVTVTPPSDSSTCQSLH